MTKRAAVDLPTSYAVGSSPSSGGAVFTDYFVPGEGKVRVIDKSVFIGALREGGKVIQSLFNGADLYREINVASCNAPNKLGEE